MLDDQDALADALDRCAEGDRSALRAIFESEGGRLVAVAERILRRRDLAEEVVQDSLVQIWTKARQYSPDRGSARGWIYAITRNRALNALRSARREETSDDIERIAEAHQAAAAEVDDCYERLDARSRLRVCLEQLDETRRRCILMAYVLGYTHGEIAGRLKAPLGTTKAWIRRGLSALRECLS